MIGNHEKVVGPAQPGGNTGTGDDRLSPGEAVGVLRPERAADHAGIGRVTGVQMRITEEDLVGEMLFRIGRILHLSLSVLFLTHCLQRAKTRMRVPCTSLHDIIAFVWQLMISMTIAPPNVWIC